jgi:hypothetical protein
LVQDLVEINNVVAFANTQAGVYTVQKGGSPALVDDTGIQPVIAGNGAVYFAAGSGIQKLTIAASGPSATATTDVSGIEATALALDGSGTLYYVSASDNCVYKD